MQGLIKSLLKLTDNIKKVSAGKLFLLTFSDPKLKDLVVKLNLDQLRAGLTADNRTMPIYSQVSVDKFGKRPGRWTHNDTGATYDTFTVVSVTEDAIFEFADLELHDVDLQEKVKSFGKIIGLDDESRNILIREAIPIMRDIYLKEMLRGI